MYDAEIAEILRRFPEALGRNLGAEGSGKYIKLWETGIVIFAANSVDKKQFFKDALLLTIRLNKKFKVGAGTGNRVRRIVLDAFLDPGSSKDLDIDRDSISQPDSESANQSESDSDAGSSTTTDSAHSAKHNVFNSLLNELCAQHAQQKGGHGSLKDEIATGIQQLAIPARARLIIERWASTDVFQGSFDRIAEDDMQLTIDMTFSLLSQEYGPTIAEKMVLDALNIVEKLPDAQEFSPRPIL